MDMLSWQYSILQQIAGGKKQTNYEYSLAYSAVSESIIRLLPTPHLFHGEIK